MKLEMYNVCYHCNFHTEAEWDTGIYKPYCKTYLKFIQHLESCTRFKPKVN